jgi:hypothetical protein
MRKEQQIFFNKERHEENGGSAPMGRSRANMVNKSVRGNLR